VVQETNLVLMAQTLLFQVQVYQLLLLMGAVAAVIGVLDHKQTAGVGLEEAVVVVATVGLVILWLIQQQLKQINLLMELVTVLVEVDK
jgi:hypothetical protein